jgi:hypothetical protein
LFLFRWTRRAAMRRRAARRSPLAGRPAGPAFHFPAHYTPIGLVVGAGQIQQQGARRKAQGQYRVRVLNTAGAAAGGAGSVAPNTEGNGSEMEISSARGVGRWSCVAT